MADPEKKNSGKDKTARNPSDTNSQTERPEMLLAKADLPPISRDRLSSLVLPALPEREQIANYSQQLKNQEKRISRIIEDLYLPKEEKEKLEARSIDRVRVSIGEIELLRDQLEIMKRTKVSGWDQLEKDLSKVEKGLLDSLRNISRESLQNKDLEYLKKQNEISGRILEIKENIGKSYQEEVKNKEGQANTNLTAVFNELEIASIILEAGGDPQEFATQGIEKGKIPQKQELKFIRVGQRAELLNLRQNKQRQLEELEYELSQAQEGLQKIREDGTLEIKNLSNGFKELIKSTFGAGVINIADKSAKLNREQVTLLQEKVEKLIKGYSDKDGVHKGIEQLQKEKNALTVAIKVIDAEEAISQGRLEQGHRILLSIRQSDLRYFASAEQKEGYLAYLEKQEQALKKQGQEIPKRDKTTISDQVNTAIDWLGKNDKLSEAEKIAYQKHEKENQQGAKQNAALEKALDSRKTDNSKVQQDYQEQLQQSKAIKFAKVSTVAEFFRGKVPTYQGSKKVDLKNHEVVDVTNVGDGSNLRVMISQKTRNEVEKKTTAGERVVLLRELKNFSYQRVQSGSGNQGRENFYIKGMPEESIVDQKDLAIYKNGKLYSFDGKEIDQSQKEFQDNKDFVLKQLQTTRSFGFTPYVLDTWQDPYQGTKKVELYRKIPDPKNPGKLIDTFYDSRYLWNLRTESGKEVKGVKVSVELHQELLRKRENGEMLVLKNTEELPKGITLGQVDEVRRSSGKSQILDQKRHRVLSEPNMLTLDNVLLARIEDGKLVVRDFPKKDSANNAANASEQKYDSKELQLKSTENAQDVLLLLRENEDVKYFHSASSGIYQKFSNMQKALEAAKAGSARAEWIEMVRDEARTVDQFLRDPQTKERAERLKGIIHTVKTKFEKGIALSPEEQEISKNIVALENFVKVVTSDRTRHVIDSIMDKSKFNADTWENWSKTELPVILGSIAVAVASTVVVVTTMGTAAPLLVFIASTAAGAAGGIIGAEGVKQLQHWHANKYDADVISGRARFGTQSQLGQWYSQAEFFDESTGQYRTLGGEEVYASYSNQFAVSFAMQGATMLGAQVLGSGVSRFLQRPGVLEKLVQYPAGRILVNQLAKAGNQGLSAAERESLKETFERAIGEVTEEAGKETIKGAAKETLEKALGEVAEEAGKETIKGAAKETLEKALGEVAEEAGKETIKGAAKELAKVAAEEGVAQAEKTGWAKARETAAKIWDEFKDEIGDEISEGLVEKSSDPILRAILSSDPNNQSWTDSAAGLTVATIKSIRIGKRTFAYSRNATPNSGKSEYNIEKLVAEAKANGTEVQDLGDGIYSFRNSQTRKSVIFMPSDDLEALSNSDLEKITPSKETDSAEDVSYMRDPDGKEKGEVKEESPPKVEPELKLDINIFDVIAQAKNVDIPESQTLQVLELFIQAYPKQIAKQIEERGLEKMQLSEEGKWKLLELFFEGDKVALSPGVEITFLDADGGKSLSPREQFKRLRPYLKSLPKIELIWPQDGGNITMTFQAEVFQGEPFTLILSPTESTKRQEGALGMTFIKSNRIYLPLYAMSETKFLKAVYEEVLHLIYGKNEFYVKLFRDANVLPGDQQRPTAENILEESLTYYEQPAKIAKSVETAVALVQDLDLEKTVDRVLSDLRRRNLKDFNEAEFLAQIEIGIRKGNQRREEQGWKKISSRYINLSVVEAIQENSTQTAKILNNSDPLSLGTDFPQVVLQEDTEHKSSSGSFIGFKTDSDTSQTVAVIGMDPKRLQENYTNPSVAAIPILLHEYGHAVSQRFNLVDKIRSGFFGFFNNGLDKSLNPDGDPTKDISFVTLFEESFADAIAMRLGNSQGIKALSPLVNDTFIDTRFKDRSSKKDALDRILKPFIICEQCLANPTKYGLSAENITLLQNEYAVLQQELTELLASKGASEHLQVVMDCLRAGWAAGEDFRQKYGKPVRPQVQIDLEEKLLATLSEEEKGFYFTSTYSSITSELVEELIRFRDSEGQISPELLAALALRWNYNTQEHRNDNPLGLINKILEAVALRIEFRTIINNEQELDTFLAKNNSITKKQALELIDIIKDHNIKDEKKREQLAYLCMEVAPWETMEHLKDFNIVTEEYVEDLYDTFMAVLPTSVRGAIIKYAATRLIDRKRLIDELVRTKRFSNKYLTDEIVKGFVETQDYVELEKIALITPMLPNGNIFEILQNTANKAPDHTLRALKLLKDRGGSVLTSQEIFDIAFSCLTCNFVAPSANFDLAAIIDNEQKRLELAAQAVQENRINTVPIILNGNFHLTDEQYLILVNSCKRDSDKIAIRERFNLNVAPGDNEADVQLLQAKNIAETVNTVTPIIGDETFLKNIPKSSSLLLYGRSYRGVQSENGNYYYLDRPVNVQDAYRNLIIQRAEEKGWSERRREIELAKANSVVAFFDTRYGIVVAPRISQIADPEIRAIVSGVIRHESRHREGDAREWQVLRDQRDYYAERGISFYLREGELVAERRNGEVISVSDEGLKAYIRRNKTFADSEVLLMSAATNEGAVSTPYMSVEDCIRVETDRLHAILKSAARRSNLGNAETAALQRVADGLRNVVNNDPIYQEMGVKLPDNFEVVVLEGKEINAFIFPNHPETVFVYEGLIKSFDGDLDNLEAVIAHEQGHVIFEEVLETRYQAPKSRQGEDIWQDPWSETLASPIRDGISQRLASSRTELFCDTHGAMYPLFLLGKNPKTILTVLRKLTADQKEVVDFDSDRDVFDMLKSHPHGPYRAQVARAVLEDYGFAYRDNTSNQLKLEIPSADQVTSDNVAQKILDNCNILPWIASSLHSYYLSGKFQDTPFSDNLINDLREMSDLQREEAIALFMQLPYLISSIVTELKWEYSLIKGLGEDAIIEYAFKERPLSSESLDQLFSDEEVVEIERRIENDSEDKSTKQSLQRFKNNWLELFEKLCVEFPGQNLDRVCSLSSGVALSSLEDLAVFIQNFPNFKPAGIDYIQSFFTALNKSKKAICYEMKPKEERGRGYDYEKKEIRFRDNILVSVCTRVLNNLAKGENLLTKSAQEEAQAMIRNEFLQLAKSINSAEDFCDSLELLRKAVRSNLSSPFATFSEIDIFLLGMEHILSLPQDEQLAFLDEFHLRGFQPAAAYFDLRNGEELSRFELLRHSTSDETFEKIKKLWPHFADVLVLGGYEKGDEKEWKSGIDQQKLIRLNEPIFFGVSGPINLHDLCIKSNDGLLKPRLRGNEEIDDYLKELKNIPCKYSREAWVMIAESAVREFSDLIKLQEFFLEQFRITDPELTPWLASNRVISGIAILETGLDSLQNNAKIDWNNSEVRKQVVDLIIEIPRTPQRNGLIKKVISCIPRENLDLKQEVQALVALLETEPVGEMLSQLARQIHDSSDSDFLFFEKTMEEAPRAAVSEKQYLGYQSLSREQQLDANKALAKFRKIFEAGRGHLPNNIDSVPCVGFSWEVCYDGSEFETLEIPNSPLIRELKDQFPIFAMPTAVRYSLFELLQEKNAAPQLDLPTKSESLKAAEEAGELALELLAIPDPRKVDPFSTQAALSNENFWTYLDQGLCLVQPSPSPLRDQMIFSTLEHFENNGGNLSGDDLRRLQKLLFYPENVEKIGLRLWGLLKIDLLSAKDQMSTKEVLAEIEKILPFYSIRRNEVLTEVRSVVQSYDYTDARRMHLLNWVPGLPVALPTTESSGAQSAMDFQIKLLRNFEDDEVVEFLLYTFGIFPDKPWTVEYMEYGMGFKLDSLINSTKEAEPSQRRALLHELFGGATGLFARNDVYALKQLAKQLANSVAVSMNADSELETLLQEISADIFYRAGFPVKFRVELLAALFEWNSKKDESKDPDELKAELLFEVAKTAGSAGVRLLQGIIIEPGLLPEALKPHLRAIQDDVGLGGVLAPFHGAMSDGVDNIVLGRPRGSGSIAEVHTLLEVEGKELVDPMVGKFGRSGALHQLDMLEKPLKLLAATVERCTGSWGEKAVQTVVDSCRSELASLAQEAELTGMPFAQIVAKVFAAKLTRETDAGLLISFKHPSTGVVTNIVIPKSDAVESAETRNSFFAMSDLGSTLETTAASDRLCKTEGMTLEQYYQEHGASISNLADLAVILFFSSFLDQDVLIGDLHHGNTGMLLDKNSQATAYTLLDFGSVEVNYPRYWKNWVMRLCTHAYQKNFDELRLDLQEARYFAEGKNLPTAEDPLAPKLEALMTAVQDALAGGSTSSLESVKQILSFLYEQWPLPKEVLNFCEALRKLEREWGPYVSKNALDVLSKQVAGKWLKGKVFGLFTAKQEGEERDQEFEAAVKQNAKDKSMTEEDFYNEAGSNNDASFFEEAELIPKGAVFVVQTDDGWIKLEASQEHDFGRKSIQAGTSGRIINRNTKGYIEFEGKRITISKYFELGD